MKISTKGRYALRMMIDLAVHGAQSPVSLKDTSQRQGISMKYMEQIAAILTKAGYVTSIRGAQGGYMLAKPAADYTVGDILRTTERSLAPVSCLEEGSVQCERCGSCPTVGFWKGLYQAVNDYVDSVSLQDMAEEQKQLGSREHVI
jgi:Rrf2 family protein